jgi:DNA primase
MALTTGLASMTTTSDGSLSDKTSHHYSEFAHQINLESFYEGIEWIPEWDDGKGNDVGFCPDPWELHKNGDTTGKFAIHRDKRVYNCWVCGGGSLLSLVMALKGLGHDDAIDWLIQFATEQTDEQFENEIEEILAIERRENPPLPWFNERVIEPWVHNVGEIADWIQSRGISSEVARKARLGYDPAHKRISRKGEYVGEAVIFPHMWEGRLVGWQERWLEPQPPRPKWIAKYTNTTDLPASITVYNFENVYLSEGPIVVCESVPTVLFLASLGIDAVATFGASVSDAQLRLLRRLHQGLILAPDNDGPGEKFVQQCGEYLERFVNVKVAPQVDGEGSDLGDLVEEPNLVHLVLDAAEYF